MLVMDPRYHRVIHTTITEWLGREFPSRPLFVFHNTWIGQSVFEIGEWLKPGLCHEWCIIGPSLDGFDRVKAAQLRWELNMTEEIRKQILQYAKTFNDRGDQQEMDERAEARDYWKWVKRNVRSESQFINFMAGEA